MASWNLAFTRERTDVTSFCDANKVSLTGLPAVTGGFEGFFDTDDFRQLVEAADSDTGTVVRITPTTLAPDYYFQGPANIDYTITGSTTDAIKVSVTLEANGDWIKILGGSPA